MGIDNSQIHFAFPPAMLKKVRPIGETSSASFMQICDQDVKHYHRKVDIMRSICIKNVTICTMDEENSLLNGSIFIEDSTIKYVGAEYRQEFDAADRVIDGSHKLAIPSLVNMHTHAAMTLFRNYANDRNLQDWLFNYIFPLEDMLTDDDIYWGACLAMLEMISSGTTCFCDMYQSMEKVAQAVDECGMKANLSRGLLCNETSADSIRNNRQLNENIDLYLNWNGHPRINVSFGVHSVYTCSVEYLKYIRSIVEKYQASIHVHVDETYQEHVDCLRTHSKTPAMHLDRLGILDFPTVAAHCVHIAEEDMEILAKRNCYVVHNPSSNLKLGSGIAPVQKMLDKGVNVCLGTDGASSNNNLSMIKEMNLCSLLSKGATMQPLSVPAAQALKMATAVGGKASGFPLTGQIKEGWAADLVLIDCDQPHLYPLTDIVPALIYSSQSSDVWTVICDGKLLYHKRQHLAMDFEKIKYHVQKILKRVFHQQ